MDTILPVVMAGGSGTRLWPLSRSQFPKQFLALQGENTLFQDAVRRISLLASDQCRVAPPCVVGNDEHRFLLLDQLRELRVEPGTVLLEPMGRNTAPAVTLAALNAVQAGGDPIMVVAPADQTVADEATFANALRVAVAQAATGAIAIMGVTPDKAETGYGYILCRAATQSTSAETVESFVEKPDAPTAERYLKEGGYFWNSGLFVMRASVWLTAIQRFRPDIAKATQTAWDGRKTDAAFVRPAREAFAAIPAESVDYAVMEPCVQASDAPALKMVKLDAGWSDLGAWEALWTAMPKDAQGNATHGDAIMVGSENSMVYATNRLVATVGLKDIVVIETADSVLVAERGRSQEVKAVVEQLKQSGRSEQVLHRQVHRPWGWYDSVDSGPRFQVKRIMVKPGASLSLQMHHHRAEHWIVVAGTAEVTCGDKKLILSENQSTYIPLGEVHRLANPGRLPLEIIEVQSGSYLGEDDIVRFEDTYGRTV
jgi:mannose-1-phosphate guanylyltransferase / mannose-6-phosphate isomerase